MGIGNQKDNYTFYNGYEGEPEIILTIDGVLSIHIWGGYFDDIYDSPTLDGQGWKGFTRDYHQLEGIFADGTKAKCIDPSEYLEDILQYKDKPFDFAETTSVFELIVSLLRQAENMNTKVMAEIA